MTEYSKQLKDDSVKAKIVMGYHGDNKSSYELSREYGISPRAIQMFISKQTHLDWWMANEDIVDNYFNGFTDSDCPTPEHQIGIWPPYRPEKSKGSVRVTDAYGADVEFKFDRPKKILVIADTQAKPNVSLDYMKWIGKYIFDKKPDIVVHIGDAYDFESLSSYDKGKKSFEGRRLKADIEAGNKSMELLLAEFQKDGYNPRLVFCSGNHENRFDRLADNMPELDGFVGTDTLPLAEMGWEVQPFLKPINIEGIFFVHYLANPMTGKPYGGNAMNQLKTVGNSFVVGHKQCLDVAIRPTLDGKHQIGIINGAAYDFHEAYKGETGNNHFRGITMLHEVTDGFGLPMFISLDYLKNRYEGN
jgi:hypothetical protein